MGRSSTRVRSSLFKLTQSSNTQHATQKALHSVAARHEGVHHILYTNKYYPQLSQNNRRKSWKVGKLESWKVEVLLDDPVAIACETCRLRGCFHPCEPT